jgi:hypothetical protein
MCCKKLPFTNLPVMINGRGLKCWSFEMVKSGDLRMYSKIIALQACQIAKLPYLRRPKRAIFSFIHFPHGSKSFLPMQERQQGVTN